MKTFVFLSLSALLMMCSVSSCHLVFNHEPDVVLYSLDISFRDASGNDLVKGIGLDDLYPADVPEGQAQSGSVKRDLYVLDIIASPPCQDAIDSWNASHFVTPDHKLGMDKFDRYWFLTTNIGFMADDCPNEKMLTFRLKCPYVFGDDAKHELVAYWDVPKIRNNSAYAKCNRVEFEGKVFTPILPQEGYNYKVVIVLPEDFQ
jgi:hypothetical protein